MSQSPQMSLGAMSALCLVMLIDSLGLGILFPLMNPVFLSPGGILPVSASPEMREVFYGITLAIFTLGMFFSAPILGDISDQIGRRKVLLFSLVGTAIAYGIAGIAISDKSVSLLLISRLLAGLTAGSQPIAQAAMIDISPENKKATYLSICLFSISIGFMLGPLAGGYLTDKSIVSWFTLSTPLYFSMVISLLNIVLLGCFFTETYQSSGRLKISFYKAIELFTAAFTTKSIRWLSIIFLFAMSSWSLYYQFAAVLMNQVYHYSTNQVGIYMSVIAVGFGSAFLFVIPWVTRYFRIINIALAVLIIYALGAISTAFIPHVSAAWISAVVCATTTAVFYTALITLCSNQVGIDKQGWIMGVMTSVNALCWTTSAATAGLTLGHGALMPFIIGAIFAVVAVVLMIIYCSVYRKQAKSTQKLGPVDNSLG